MVDMTSSSDALPMHLKLGYIMAIFTLFDQTQIAPISDEKQGYIMAIFTLFDQTQIAPTSDEKQGYILNRNFDSNKDLKHILLVAYHLCLYKVACFSFYHGLWI